MVIWVSWKVKYRLRGFVSSRSSYTLQRCSSLFQIQVHMCSKFIRTLSFVIQENTIQFHSISFKCNNTLQENLILSFSYLVSSCFTQTCFELSSSSSSLHCPYILLVISLVEIYLFSFSSSKIFSKVIVISSGEVFGILFKCLFFVAD